MKTPTRLVTLIAFVALLGFMLAATSCQSLKTYWTPETKAKAASIASLIIDYGQVTGKITPAQAAALKKQGALLLDPDASTDDITLAVSQALLAHAVENNKITPETAALLENIGTVALPPATTASK